MGDFLYFQLAQDFKEASAVLNYWIEYFMRNGKISSSIRPARYQLIYAFRIFHEKETPGDLGSRAVVKHAESFLHSLLKDEDSALRALEEPTKLIVALMRGKTRTEPRTSSFTNKVQTSVARRRLKISGKVVVVKKQVSSIKLAAAKNVAAKRKVATKKIAATKKVVAAKKIVKS
ncbi:MAG: hypothetical protein WAW73_03425 [Rhodoferax sp.]